MSSADVVSDTHPALPEHTVNLSPSSRPAAEVDASARKALAKSISRFPRMVVRDLARNVMRNMSLGDAMGRTRANPAHDAAEIAKQVPVKSCKGTTLERELGRAVMRKERVGVLQEGDQDKPVVHPISRISS